MCVLRVYSETDSFAEFLKDSALRPYDVWEKGDMSVRREPHEYYGFKCAVSDREWTDLDGQVEDALAFLRRYEVELRKLRETHTICDEMQLDFPYECRLGKQGIAIQGNYLPAEFLLLAGQLGIGVALSHYPGKDEDDGEGSETEQASEQ